MNLQDRIKDEDALEAYIKKRKMTIIGLFIMPQFQSWKR